MHKTTETSNSNSKVAVLNAQNYRCRLGPIDRRHSGFKYAVLYSQTNRQSLGHIETCNSNSKFAGLRAKTTDVVWDP